MKLLMKTLVDITESKARFNKSDPAWHQQQNFMTVVGTIGLRVNITPLTSPQGKVQLTKGQGFGTSYKGEQKVWEFMFETDFESAIDIPMLVNDFDMIPVISNLDETITLKESMFETTSKSRTNTVFVTVADNPDE